MDSGNGEPICYNSEKSIAKFRKVRIKVLVNLKLVMLPVSILKPYKWRRRQRIKIVMVGWLSPNCSKKGLNITSREYWWVANKHTEILLNNYFYEHLITRISPLTLGTESNMSVFKWILGTTLPNMYNNYCTTFV